MFYPINFLKKNYILITLIILLMIFFASIFPSNNSDPLFEIKYFDKFMHMFFYLILSLPICFIRPSNWKLYIIFFIIFGIFIEYIQSFVPNRTTELLDIIFNIIGIFSSIFLTHFYKKLKIFN